MMMNTPPPITRADIVRLLRLCAAFDKRKPPNPDDPDSGAEVEAWFIAAVAQRWTYAAAAQAIGRYYTEPAPDGNRFISVGIISDYIRADRLQPPTPEQRAALEDLCDRKAGEEPLPRTLETSTEGRARFEAILAELVAKRSIEAAERAEPVRKVDWAAVDACELCGPDGMRNAEPDVRCDHKPREAPDPDVVAAALAARIEECELCNSQGFRKEIPDMMCNHVNLPHAFDTPDDWKERDRVDEIRETSGVVTFASLRDRTRPHPRGLLVACKGDPSDPFSNGCGAPRGEACRVRASGRITRKANPDFVHPSRKARQSRYLAGLISEAEA